MDPDRYFSADPRSAAHGSRALSIGSRAAADWLAGLVVRGLLDADDARRLARALAYGQARQAYRLDGAPESG